MHVFNILNQVFQAAPVDDDEVGPARLAELKVEFVKRKDNKMTFLGCVATFNPNLFKYRRLLP